MSNDIAAAFRRRAELLVGVALDTEFADRIKRASHVVAKGLNTGGTILVCGNGGSAAQAQHLAAELVGRFVQERRGLPSIALVADSAVVTAIANDYGYAEVFARQVQSYYSRSNVLVAISTSGNSPNVRRAVETARDLGNITIGLLGKDGGAIAGQCDIAIIVPAANTAEIQEVHQVIIHLICEAVDDIRYE